MNKHEFRNLINIDRRKVITYLKLKLADKIPEGDLIRLCKGVESVEQVHLEDKPFLTNQEFENRAKGFPEFIKN